MNLPPDPYIHLLAGGVAGTVGAVVTCPLEVVKTRLQSSVATFSFATNTHPSINIAFVGSKSRTFPLARNLTVVKCIRHIIDTEGTKGLFKGLGPNLIGVAPTRAIYFCTYSSVKNLCNATFSTPDTPLVHVSAAASAGFVSATITNPIWFVKTRLQLDQSCYPAPVALYCFAALCFSASLYLPIPINSLYFIYMSINLKFIASVGITASYFGISETIMYFVIYEFIKNKLRERRWKNGDCSSDESGGLCFMQSMLAGALSRTCASLLVYPHEVARTRLRQPDAKYKGFVQTLVLICREEGKHALYRGLATHLFRQIPNTAIMMGIYEFIVMMLRPQS